MKGGGVNEMEEDQDARGGTVTITVDCPQSPGQRQSRGTAEKTGGVPVPVGDRKLPGPGGCLEPEYFLVAERSELPASHAFLARYREVRHFAPAALPFERSAQAVYPFADPPIRIYARRAAPG